MSNSVHLREYTPRITLTDALITALFVSCGVAVLCAYIIFWGKILVLLAPLIGPFVLLVGLFLAVFHVVFLAMVMSND